MMALGDEIEVHCLSDSDQENFLREHSSVLLDLNERYRVRIFSASETTSIPYEPYNIDIDSGLRDASGIDVGLNITVVQKHLETRWIGNTLFYCREAASTQDVLRKTFSSVRPGCVALTGFQRAGRGRRGSEWTSPGGSIAMSIAVRVPGHLPERLTFMQYIAALAAVEAVRGEPLWSRANIRIKWPNDIYADGEKIGGVLCEAAFRGGQFQVSVGVGINITNAQPTTCLRDIILKCGGIVQEEHMREIFVGKYLSSFEKAFDSFCERGFVDWVRERYLAAWMHSGQVVRLGRCDGPKAVVEGIAPSGAVRVYREDLGAFQDLPPDVSSLDLREGIIKEKVPWRATRHEQATPRR